MIFRLWQRLKQFFQPSPSEQVFVVEVWLENRGQLALKRFTTRDCAIQYQNKFNNDSSIPNVYARLYALSV